MHRHTAQCSLSAAIFVCLVVRLCCWAISSSQLQHSDELNDTISGILNKNGKCNKLTTHWPLATPANVHNKLFRCVYMWESVRIWHTVNVSTGSATINSSNFCAHAERRTLKNGIDNCLR